MLVSNATVVGACYGGALMVSRLYVLLSAEETSLSDALNGRTLLRTIGMTAIVTIPVAAFMWLLNELFSSVDGHQVGIVVCLMTAWLIASAGTVEHVVRRHVQAACGIDVVARAGLRVVWVASVLGMIASLVYVFGRSRWM